jgi:hypothetical protein
MFFSLGELSGAEHLQLAFSRFRFAFGSLNLSSDTFLDTKEGLGRCAIALRLRENRACICAALSAPVLPLSRRVVPNQQAR